MSLLRRIRQWIDGQTFSRSSPEAEHGPRDELAVEIAREIRTAMEQEQFGPPRSTPQVPLCYAIYMSPQTKKRLPGRKSILVQEWLQAETARVARTLTGRHTEPSLFRIEFLIDAALPAHSIRVRAFWEEPSKGGVEAEKKTAAGTVATFAPR